jgi:polar amino acid transport system substrate-binding protein
VGVIAAALRVAGDDTGPAAWEVSLIRGFAAEVGAQIEWIPGPEAELMDALKEHQLDLVIGGLTQSTPWGEHVALTSPYRTTIVAVGVPRSAPIVRELAGLEVAVEVGDAAGAYLKNRGAIPVFVRDPARVAGPVAAPDWKLRRWGFRDTGIVLRSLDHVMAVPPGENGWLVRLEQFLRNEAN